MCVCLFIVTNDLVRERLFSFVFFRYIFCWITSLSRLLSYSKFVSVCAFSEIKIVLDFQVERSRREIEHFLTCFAVNKCQINTSKTFLFCDIALKQAILTFF